jgi:hypothetical protein
MKTTEMSYEELSDAMDAITDKAVAGQKLTPAEEKRLAALERAWERRNDGRW